MKNTCCPLRLPLTILFNLVIILNIHCQTLNFNSLVKTRSELLRSYDSSLSVTQNDTVLLHQLSTQKEVEQLIAFDNKIIDSVVSKILISNDSLVRLNNLHESGFKSQSDKIRNLYYFLVFSAGLGIIGIILALVLLSMWLKRRKAIRKLSTVHLETERILSEYRKRQNELQSDLDNSITQAKNLVHENSRLEKDIIQLNENIQKARDAGWLNEPGQVSYPEQIKALQDQLTTEATNKKILEQEILEILRKLRGEED